MNCLFHRLIVSVALATASCAGAHAADMPVKAPPGAAVAKSSSGLYLWVDGSYQSVNLPSYDLGFRRRDDTGADQLDAGPLQTFKPRASGYGISGAFGYAFPYGVIPSLFGAASRIEIGGSYVRIDANQSGTVREPTSMSLFTANASTFSLSFGCGAAGCVVGSRLATGIKAWQINGRAINDIKVGNATISPWLGVFRGDNTNDQTLVQTFNIPPLMTYTAVSSVKWTDWGARLGLDVRQELTSAVAIGLGGHVGVARRQASMSLNDLIIGIGSGSRTGSISASESATAFLANAEASIAIKPTPVTTVRAFAGLNYDDRVPAISSLTWTGDQGAPTSITRPGIKHHAETSYYAGGGLTVKLGP